MSLHTEAPNLAVITCVHILEHNHDILVVSHDEDDAGWQFLCGKENHIESDGKIIALKEILELDTTLHLLNDLPVGSIATRTKKNESWKIEEG